MTDTLSSDAPHAPYLEPPTFPRRRWLPRSLTGRLVGGVVSLVVLLVLVIGSGTYYALRSFLDARLDQQVRSTAAQNAPYFESCLRDAVLTSNGYRCDGGPPTQREWVAAIDASSGRAVTFSGGEGNYISPLSLSRAQVEAFRSDPRQIISVSVDGYQLRAGGAENRDGLIVVTGLSAGEISRTTSRLVALELFIGGAAVIVAVVFTTFWVRRSLRNLYRVTGTAQEVAAELSPTGSGLDRRVPVVEEGTEVGQLAESFNTMLAAVETQFAARVVSEERMRQFMADASHELRTPLTSIRGYAELARMQRAVGETVDDNLARIEADGTRMSRLIEDLLMLARGDAGGRPVERRLIDIRDLLDDTVSGARAAYPGRVIDVQVSGAPHVLGDNDQLLRAIRNLVNNAAVHTDPRRPILLRSWADPQAVTIQVVDGGPGLPPEQAALVFERFWRADKARTRARGGTGLGMSIVASIVRAHSGDVRFDSSVENGSTVTVRLPAAQAE